MTRVVGLVAAILLWSNAMAQRPVITVDATSPRYSTLDEAAKALCDVIAIPRMRLLSSPQEKELGGVIFKTTQGDFQISSTVPGMHDRLEFAARVPHGYTLAGIVHSHPTTLESGQVFSPKDVQIAKQLGVPSYVQFDAAGECRKYVPGKTRTYAVDTVGGPGTELVADGDALDLPQRKTSIQTVPTNTTQPLFTASK